MTTSDTRRIYVWGWLPGATEPVPAGVLSRSGSTYFFNYGRSYLDRPDAIPLYLSELPLQRGRIRPLNGLNVAGVILDAAPDAWGQRLILQRLTGVSGREADPGDLDLETYLLESGSDRTGALDFQGQSDTYIPRESKGTLAELVDATARIDAGEALTPDLEAALLGGSSLGGTRPKAPLYDDGRALIVKFSSKSDTFPIVKAEAAAMHLARKVGLNVATAELTESYGHDVLLVERFDRTPTLGERRAVVSALTILELPEHAARHATYPDLADSVRRRFVNPTATLRELFSRIVFNICIGNTDDHARNHAAFWDGADLDLTPAFDICPYPRTGRTASQAMAIDRSGMSLSQLALCVDAASIYGLSPTEATDIVDAQVDLITDEWKEVAELCRLTNAENDALWGRAILNPFALEGYR